MNLPPDFAKYMQTMLGNEYADFENAMKSEAFYRGIRINTLKPSNEFENFEKIAWCSEGRYIDKSSLSGKNPLHMCGLFYFQEPSAMSAVAALPINEGDLVLDLCAAPGGKSTHAAAKLNGSGMIVCNEIIPSRARILAENIERMGIKNALITNESPGKLEDRFENFFDKIIVDAPCSGEGMFRKEPQAMAQWSLEHTISCSARQKNILDSAVKMLNKGGMLLYSTCTFSEKENEENAIYLSERHGLEPIMIKGMDMLDEGINFPFARRIFPHKHKGEGHFVALFQKPGSSSPKPALPAAKTDDNKLYRDFENENLNVQLSGIMHMFGNRLYLMPYNIDIDRLKVIRAGLYLGECKKNRFEPSHALALALKKEDFKRSIDVGDDEIQKYMHGDVLPCSVNGYTAVTYKGYPAGWGKGSGGILKNHYPKYLRLK